MHVLPSFATMQLLLLTCSKALRDQEPGKLCSCSTARIARATGWRACRPASRDGPPHRGRSAGPAGRRWPAFGACTAPAASPPAPPATPAAPDCVSNAAGAGTFLKKFAHAQGRPAASFPRRESHHASMSAAALSRAFAASARDHCRAMAIRTHTRCASSAGTYPASWWTQRPTP